MIRKLNDKNMNQKKEKKRGKQKQRNITRIHSLSYLLLHKTPKTNRRPQRGNYSSKNITTTLRQEWRGRYRSPRRTQARRPLTTREQGQSQNKKRCSTTEKQKTTHRRVTRAASSSSSSSPSSKATTAPSEKGEQYSVKGTNKQQEDKAY